MSRLTFLAAALAFASSVVPEGEASAAENTARVGVIAVGSDPDAAGELQQALEQRLRGTPDTSTRNVGQMAAALGSTAAGSTNDAARRSDKGSKDRAEALLREASNAYYQDRAALALERLGALAVLQDQDEHVAATDRVRLYLWRTAVFLALQDKRQAEAEALAALTLDPELKVDLKEFRPSVRDAVDSVRAGGLRMVTVLVHGLPSSAEVRIDDRVVGPRFQVPVGIHRLLVSAPGRGEVARRIDVQSDLSIPISLPIALEPALAEALAGMLWRGSPAPSDVQVLSDIAKRAEIEWLVVAGIRESGPGSLPATRGRTESEARAMLLSLRVGGPTFTSQTVAAGLRAWSTLADWATQKLEEGIASATVAKRPNRPASPAEPRPIRAEWTIDARAGISWSARTRSFRGGENGFTTSFSGVGPRISVDAARRSLFAGLEANWQTFGISTLAVRLPDGSQQSIGGGSTTAIGAGFGYRHSFGRAGDYEGSPTVRAALTLEWDQHAAKDVRGSSNENLGLLTSYQRIAAGVRAGGRYPILVGAHRVAAFASAGAAPVGSWTEVPSGTSGSSPKPGLAARWSAGVGYEPSSGRWDVRTGYEGEVRSVKFTGSATAPVVPPIEDATIRESFHTFATTFRWRF